jgi:DNA-binding NtrC family response regulator
VYTDIRAVIISDDSVSSSVLSRTLKEWWCSDVNCAVFPTVQAALQSRFVEQADIVFIADRPDEVEMFKAIRAMHARASNPICVVLTSAQGPAARAIALRAGAHECISRYVVTEDDIHRCLWGVLRERTANQLKHFAAPRLANA